MKVSTLLTRSVLAASTLFVGLNASAQAITYAPISNVDMLVANIFGVQCEGVSNVQISGAPVSVGRFDHGQGVGLNSGMMLTTGIPNYSLQPYSFFANTQLGTPGDIDIINYGNMSGTGATSADACAVEFDFTPLVTDTIRFTYIFASEEYPEFSGSAFNDRFMFLVSENGNTPANIAQVPGTTTAVEINSINQFTNAQYYIDNAMAPSAAYFVFDGYTVPLEAKFYAQVGSTYHIKLVISDIADAAFDSAIFLDEQEAYNDIEGQLTVNGLPAEGILDIFNFVDGPVLATPVQSIVVTGGTYLADSLSSGLYHARFTPDPVLFPGAVPLYFESGATWSTATLIGLPCYLNSADIDADTVNGNDGTSTVTGNIVIDTSYLKTVTEPFAGAFVQLVDAQTNETVAFAWSDANGDYQLTGIPAGTFHIAVDVPYIPQADTYTVTLEAGQNGTAFDFEILSNGIFSSGDGTLGIASNEYLPVAAMHPNPANEFLYVSVPGSAATHNVSITTLGGQVVQTASIGAGNQAIATKGLANGTYIIRVEGAQPQRLVIQH